MGALSGPPRQAVDDIGLEEIKIDSIAFGWLLGFTVLASVKAVKQTTKSWRRTGRLTTYIMMLWLDILACIMMGLVCWLCMHGTIQESFTFFFVGTTLRCAITQLTIQILANRISILIVSERVKTLIRWIPFFIILVLNVGVYCIWIPAHLKVRQPYWNINKIYSRFEKAAYMILDLSLNFYFMYLVKNRLIDSGFRKYRSLFRFNLAIVFVGASLDILLIGLMNLPNALAYVQFYPALFICKIYIEMCIADVIVKVAHKGDSVVARGGPHQDEDPRSDVEGKDHSSDSSRPESNLTQAWNDPAFVEKHSARAYNRQCDRNINTNRPFRDGLYHAWISSDMSSSAVPGSEGVTRVMPNRQIQVVHKPASVQPGIEKRESINVITKDTLVLIRSESG